jgi:Na+/H+-dicarboxylate symporter
MVELILGIILGYVFKDYIKETIKIIKKVFVMEMKKYD